jgi:hypothetical protein
MHNFDSIAIEQIVPFCKEYGYTSIQDIRAFNEDGWTIEFEGDYYDYHLNEFGLNLLYGLLNMVGA